MALTKTVLSEVWGLFVDDGSFAVAVVVWLGVAGLVLTHLCDLGGWAGVTLFVGLAAILVESVVRRAR